MPPTRAVPVLDLPEPRRLRHSSSRAVQGSSNRRVFGTWSHGRRNLNPEPHDVQPQNFVDEDGFYNENLAHNVKLRHSVRSLPMHLVPQRLLQRRLKASTPPQTLQCLSVTLKVDAPPLSSDPTWASEILEAGAKVSFAENSGACDNSGDGAIVSTEASPELGSSTKCKDIPELLTPKIKIHTPEGSSKTYDEEASQDNREPPLSCHLGSSSTDNATRYGGPQQESADEQRGSSYSLTVVLPITPSAEDSKELKRRISNGGPRPVAPLTEARNQETDIQLHVEYPSSNLPEGIENQQPQLSKTDEANS
ncbi:hypothetical protein CC79DRAFT_1376604 [Sarocladium strictum]